MFTATEDNPVGCIPIAVLILKGPQGEHCVRSLIEGNDLLVGSDESADLRVSGENVSSMHCMLRVRGGKVFVRDCYSRSGTFVNGQKVSEVQIENSAALRVGDFALSITINESSEDENAAATSSMSYHPVPAPAKSDQQQSTGSMSGQSSTQERQQHGAARSTVPGESSAVSPTDEVALQTIQQLQFELEHARSEIEILHDQLTLATSMSSSVQTDPWQDEMLELLRAEVLELQGALSQKDSSNSTTDAAAAHDRLTDTDLLPRDEADKLVERLEYLLQELAERDEQVTLLNNLLETAENANRAEQEQRQQLDAWVGSIEQRMGLREEEWEAERDRLLDNLQRLTSERDQAEATVLSGSASTRLESLQRMMTEMREEMDSLRKELAQSETECAKLKREVQDADKQDFTEEAIRISQERAELARLRHELEITGAVPRVVSDSSESSLRFQALREHLKEIHENEKQQRQEATLGSRIARLWHRMEGR